MNIVSIIVLSLLGLYFITWVGGLIWLAYPFNLGILFFHDILGWHKPNGESTFDGLSEHSHCRFCGEEIMQDSQGNWFTF